MLQSFLKNSSWVVLLTSLVSCSNKPNNANEYLSALDYSAVSYNLAATSIEGKVTGSTIINGSSKDVIKADTIDTGIVLPNGNDGVIILPGSKRVSPNPELLDARELKLKIRELADQLLQGTTEFSAGNVLVMPVSFVSLNDFEETSSFGRLIAEEMFYELNQRGVPVKEYRQSSYVTVKEDGDFFLSQKAKKLATNTHTRIVAGTYLKNNDIIVINARIINPISGMVVSSGNLVFQGNSFTNDMITKHKASSLPTISVSLKNINDEVSKIPLSPVDLGEDVH